MKPSQSVLDICNKHHFKKCAGCPIRQACHTIGPTHTQRQLDAWVYSVNKMAKEIRFG